MTDDTDSTQLQGGLPVVRLRPKANARANQVSSSILTSSMRGL